MITLNNNNLEITEGTFQSDSRTMLSSPSVTPEMDDNMTKAEYIKEAQNLEFPFDIHGICGVNDDGIVVSYGEPCKVEIDGKEVIANLWKLPKVWAECCVDSNYFDEWISPEYADEYHKMYMRQLELEFGGK